MQELGWLQDLLQLIVLPFLVIAWSYANTRKYYHKAMAETYRELSRILAVVSLSRRSGEMGPAAIDAEIRRITASARRGNGAG